MACGARKRISIAAQDYRRGGGCMKERGREMKDGVVREGMKGRGYIF